VSEIATENNSTTLFPIPIDLFRPFIDRLMSPPSERAAAPSPQVSADAGDAKMLNAPSPADIATGAAAAKESVPVDPKSSA
jgi:hypothetical protein